jgi:uncharacterized membrane protein YccF (DUF307 family)
MRLLLNVTWLLFAGIWLAAGYVLAGALCMVLIVTIPFGIASFRIANYVLWPFGREVVDRPGAGVMSAVGNVIWVLVAGIWLAVGHLVTAVTLFATIIGIPMAIANLKLIPVSLTPLGKQIITTDQPFGYAVGPLPVR